MMSNAPLTTDPSSMLTNLPNEILYRIIDQVHPHDIENLASSCKSIQLLAEPAVKLHRQRQDLQILILSIFSDTKCDTSPLAVLQAIAEDWRVAVYPTAVAFRCPLRIRETDDSHDAVDDDELDQLFV